MTRLTIRSIFTIRRGFHTTAADGRFPKVSARFLSTTTATGSLFSAATGKKKVTPPLLKPDPVRRTAIIR